MRTEITIKGDWKEVMNDARFTQGKKPLDKEPSDSFKQAILLAEHTPIRAIHVKWVWRNILHWVGVHWVRHRWHKLVSSQREDATGIPRSELPQTAKQDFMGEANPHELIDTFRKRLCRRASPETRYLAEDFKVTLHKQDPIIADVLVPHCVYRCGCPEMKCCGFWGKFVKVYPEALTDDLQRRYKIYNDWFYEGGK